MVVTVCEIGALRVTFVCPVEVSSNNAVPPLAQVCETPLTFQLFAVVVSQLPSVKPLQTNASEVMFNWIVLPLVERLPPAPVNVPRVTGGAEPLVHENNG